MEYHRIDEHTIRCIITPDDMQNNGLDLDEFFAHTEKSDEFLKRIVDEAREELGYETDHGLVSMRLEVMPDGNISLTFFSGSEEAIKNQMSKYLKHLFPDMDDSVLERVINQMARMTDAERREKLNEVMGESIHHTIANKAKALLEAAGLSASSAELPKNNARTGKQKKIEDSVSDEKAAKAEDTYRIYCFESLSKVIEYCKAVGLKGAVRSHLVKAEGDYYLVVEKYRISDKRYNRMTMVGFDYGTVLTGHPQILEYLDEYGEVLIDDKAYGTLRKL